MLGWQLLLYATKPVTMRPNEQKCTPHILQITMKVFFLGLLLLVLASRPSALLEQDSQDEGHLRDLGKSTFGECAILKMVTS